MVIDAFYCEMGSHKKMNENKRSKTKKKRKKNNHYKKNDEGVKEEAYKSGCGLDINILRNKLAQIKTLEHTSTLFWLGKKKKRRRQFVWLRGNPSIKRHTLMLLDILLVFKSSVASY